MKKFNVIKASEKKTAKKSLLDTLWDIPEDDWEFFKTNMIIQYERKTKKKWKDLGGYETPTTLLDNPEMRGIIEENFKKVQDITGKKAKIKGSKKKRAQSDFRRGDSILLTDGPVDGVDINTGDGVLIEKGEDGVVVKWNKREDTYLVEFDEAEGEVPSHYMKMASKKAKLTSEAQDFISKKISILIDEGKSQDQAVAIAYSMAREKGYDVPKKSSKEELPTLLDVEMRIDEVMKEMKTVETQEGHSELYKELKDLQKKRKLIKKKKKSSRRAKLDPGELQQLLKDENIKGGLTVTQDGNEFIHLNNPKKDKERLMKILRDQGYEIKEDETAIQPRGIIVKSASRRQAAKWTMTIATRKGTKIGQDESRVVVADGMVEPWGTILHDEFKGVETPWQKGHARDDWRSLMWMIYERLEKMGYKIYRNGNWNKNVPEDATASFTVVMNTSSKKSSKVKTARDEARIFIRRPEGEYATIDVYMPEKKKMRDLKEEWDFVIQKELRPQVDKLSVGSGPQGEQTVHVKPLSDADKAVEWIEKFLKRNRVRVGRVEWIGDWNSIVGGISAKKSSRKGPAFVRPTKSSKKAQDLTTKALQDVQKYSAFSYEGYDSDFANKLIKDGLVEIHKDWPLLTEKGKKYLQKNASKKAANITLTKISEDSQKIINKNLKQWRKEWIGGDRFQYPLAQEVEVKDHSGKWSVYDADADSSEEDGVTFILVQGEDMLRGVPVSDILDWGKRKPKKYAKVAKKVSFKIKKMIANAYGAEAAKYLAKDIEANPDKSVKAAMDQMIEKFGFKESDYSASVESRLEAHKAYQAVNRGDKKAMKKFNVSRNSKKKTSGKAYRAGSQTLIALYIADGYLAGASSDRNAGDISYWPSEMWQDNEWELVELKRVPEELVEQLEAQGTSDQHFSDGYDAANAAAKYAGEVIDDSSEYMSKKIGKKKAMKKFNVSRNSKKKQVKDISKKAAKKMSEEEIQIELASAIGSDPTDLDIKQQKDFGITYWEVEDGREEYLVFMDTDDADEYATKRLEDELEDEPYILGGIADWLVKDNVFVGAGDIRLISQEEGDFAVEDLDNEEAVERAGMEDEYDEAIENDDLDKAEEIAEKAKEQISEEVTKEWEEGLKQDPIGFLVDDLGMYTEEQLLSDEVAFVQVDLEGVAKGVIQNDGSGPTLATYDGVEQETKAGLSYFRTN